MVVIETITCYDSKRLLVNIPPDWAVQLVVNKEYFIEGKC